LRSSGTGTDRAVDAIGASIDFRCAGDLLVGERNAVLVGVTAAGVGIGGAAAGAVRDDTVEDDRAGAGDGVAAMEGENEWPGCGVDGEGGATGVEVELVEVLVG
jgi:hypothetical protein